MARGGSGLGNRLAPPRFIVFLTLLVAGFIGYWQLPGAESLADAAAMSFDLAAAVFLTSILPLLRDANTASIRRHAANNDANRLLVLIITTVVTMVVLAAISGELPPASAGNRMAMVKLVGTLLLTWLFANTVYALHYAHLFYSSRDGKDTGGIDFPGTTTPDYLDFIYFSFTLGMTFQTSDTEITSKSIRRIATAHSFAAFIFNIGVIAFTINALG
ncbi:DUF1345 domain-containing protein [Novosphingobium sp. ERN07]|uniref:DUF1345 domain-containing protein n=1 Tax=Novosphingobium sp. ERN07 TaxID=2726187 RepID=UPI0014570943|nr:DUF1345 domain-containing protein [Novosphingobium sp. ERN07]NLR69813.1 DUF1345 domain-containing protein [Novosphingobium sp. ERN07]